MSELTAFQRFRRIEAASGAPSIVQAPRTPTRRAVSTNTNVRRVPTPTQTRSVTRLADPRAVASRTPGGSLNALQIAQAAFDAGFRGDALVQVVSIALAESNGNPQAVNPRGELSIGLMQINIDPNTSWGRARAQKYGGQRGLMDPLQNMKAAFDISQGGRTFRPWSVHPSSPSPHAGASTRHLNTAFNAVQRLMTLGPQQRPVDYRTGDPRVGRQLPVPMSDEEAFEESFGPGFGFDDPGAPRTSAEVEDYIREHYGHLAWALDHDEVGPILRRAAREQWSEGRLQGAIFQTNWWQNHSEAQRQWQALEGQDPQEAERRIEQRISSLSQRLEQFGIPIHNRELRQMARDSLRFGWDESETQSGMAAYMRRRGMRRTIAADGRVAQFVDQAQNLSRNEFFLPMTDRQAWNHAIRMVEGTGDINSVRQSLVDPAAQRFRDFRDRIQAGETPREVFDPYIAIGGELLEIDPETIDPVGDSRFAPMTDHVTVDGDRRAMTMHEWMRHVRRLPDFRTTSRAMEDSANLASALVSIFGKGVL